MRSFVDLHCHWLPGVDDGARSLAEAVELLEALHGIGFERVFATPHMRPGLFDNSASSLRSAYDSTQAQLQKMSHLPERDLSSEHFFDELVLQRLASGQGLPYPGGGAVLLEFYDNSFPPRVDQLLAELRRGGLVPVVAHPERYRILWQRPEILERLLDVGAVALLDVAALVGKYGRGPQRCAELLLERGAYRAACSDAHRPEDVSDVARAIRWITDHYGEDELHSLLSEGPRAILSGPSQA